MGGPEGYISLVSVWTANAQAGYHLWELTVFHPILTWKEINERNLNVFRRGFILLILWLVHMS